MHILSQARLGLDLTRMRLPAFILEKRSTLEMCSEFLAHPDIFTAWVEHISILLPLATTLTIPLNLPHSLCLNLTLFQPPSLPLSTSLTPTLNLTQSLSLSVFLPSVVRNGID